MFQMTILDRSPSSVIVWNELPLCSMPSRHQKEPVWISSQWFDGCATRGRHIATIVSLQCDGTEIFKRTSLWFVVEVKLTRTIWSTLGRLDVVEIIESIVAIGNAAEVFTIAGLEGNFVLGE